MISGPRLVPSTTTENMMIAADVARRSGGATRMLAATAVPFFRLVAKLAMNSKTIAAVRSTLRNASRKNTPEKKELAAQT